MKPLLLAIFFMLFLAGCKTENKDTTCRMESVIITENNKTTSYTLEYDNNARIKKATYNEGYLIFSYSATTVTVDRYNTANALEAHTEGRLNSNGNIETLYANNITEGKKDTATYLYNAEGYVTHITTRSNGQTATGQLSYSNGNHTQSVYTGYDGKTSTIVYQFTNLPNKTGVYEEFSILLPFFGKQSANLPESRTITPSNGNTTIDNYEYELNEHQYVTRLTLTGNSNNPLTESIYYQCQ